VKREREWAKLQAPNPKLQKSSKSQAPKRASQPIQNEQIKNQKCEKARGIRQFAHFEFCIFNSSQDG
jgi:hypothetical protein